MKLRKNRPHQQGAANKDFRAQTLVRPEEQSTIDFLATAKSNKFSEILQEKAQRTAPDPLKETSEFYKELEKQVKEQAQVQNPRFANLEEIELRKRVFVGDSNTTYETVNGQKLKKKSKTLQEEEISSKEKLSNYKHEDYSKQIQETQLVGIKHNTESLEGKVDIKKVKEIRRALRRRYANRKNFQKIYNSWDEDSRGKISVKNAYDMIKKLGIKVNINEARVLVASVDQDFSGSMGLDEFMDLIFTDSDTLEVDLTQIPSVDVDKIESGELQEQAGEILATESKNLRNQRHKNQISMILKNKNKNLATLFRNADEFNCGFVTQEKLNEILHKQNIPETIMDGHDKNWIFDQFKFEDYKFNYKDFVNFLNEFQFKPQDNYIDPKDTNKSKTEVQRSMDKYKEKEDQQIHIHKVQKVNPWHFEKIRNDYRKVSRIMFRYLQKQDDFEKLFMDTYKVKNKDDLENMNINKKQLTQFVQNMFIHVGEKDVKKQEVENFLSAFQYNKHGYTKFNDIPKVIYQETDSEWYEKMQRDVHHPPPPQDLKYHPDFPIEELQEYQEQEYQNMTKSDGFQDDNISHMQQPPIANRRTQISKSSTKRNTVSTFSNFPSETIENQNLANVMQKLENRIFCGTQNSYDIFKKFDLDKDGYVSHNDIVNHIQEMAILDKNEIKQLLNYIDPEQTGHLNFRQFSDKIRDGVHFTDKLGKQTYITSTQPSKEYNDSIKNILPYLKENVESMKKPFRPTANLHPAHRFKFTPTAKNTFQNFRPDYSCPGFQNEKERFNRSHNHRTDWQKEEQLKSKNYELGRISQKRMYMTTIEGQKLNKEDNAYQREQNKRTTKGVLQWTYEHRAHLQNNWNGGGKSQLEEIRQEREQALTKPPLFGKWMKN